MFAPASKNLASREVEELRNKAKTEDGYKRGIKLYEEFARANSFPCWQNLSPEYLGKHPVRNEEEGVVSNCHSLFRRFAAFLLLPDISKKTKQGSSFTAGSAGQYFSNFKSTLQKRFPSFKYLSSPHDEWYDHLYRLVKSTANERNMKNGDPLSDGSDSIWRDILISLNLYLVGKNSAKYHMLRALFCSLYHAVGRASETGTLSWDNMVYNTSLQAPEAKWMEIKTGKEAPVSFFADSESYLIDWGHAMFCYLCSDGSASFHHMSPLVPDGRNFVFPSLVHCDPGVIAAMITRELHKIAATGAVKGLTKKHSSQGFKHGAADDVTFNPRASMVSLVARANWDYSGQSMLFRYITHKIHIAYSGRALAGWTNPTQKVHPPDVNAFLTPEYVEQYEKFGKLLFWKTGLEDLHDISRLKPFRDQMVATFLMHLPAYTKDVPDNDIILDHVYKTAKRAKLSKEVLTDWGVKISERFEAMNSAQTIDESLNPQVCFCVSKLTECVVEADKRNILEREMHRKELNILKNTCSKMVEQQSILIGLLKNSKILNQTPVVVTEALSSPKKRPAFFTPPSPEVALEPSPRPAKKPKNVFSLISPPASMKKKGRQMLIGAKKKDGLYDGAKWPLGDRTFNCENFFARMIENGVKIEDIDYFADSPDNQRKKKHRITAVWEDLQRVCPSEDIDFLDFDGCPDMEKVGADAWIIHMRRVKKVIGTAVDKMNVDRKARFIRQAYLEHSKDKYNPKKKVAKQFNEPLKNPAITISALANLIVKSNKCPNLV